MSIAVRRNKGHDLATGSAVDEMHEDAPVKDRVLNALIEALPDLRAPAFSDPKSDAFDLPEFDVDMVALFDSFFTVKEAAIRLFTFPAHAKTIESRRL